MTTAADLLRRFIAHPPDAAKSLELLPLHGKPNDDAIGVWTIEETRDPEALRTQILEAGQEHCDCEGEPLLLKACWVNKGAVIRGRRIRFAPSEGSTSIGGSGPSDPLVKELLTTIREQNRVIFNGVETVVKACKQVIEISGEQNRLLESRVQQQASIAAEVVDTEEREMRKRAFSIALERAPELLDLLIHAGATRMLNGSGKPGTGAPPQQ